ncbi:VWA domain-containing protein [Bacillus sp. T33-2]|uniref:VWA domain-containing protein n=1 Tax=Bacillus sp. T33-2 TaxID=2054168 RepID=UPI000C78F814|nr:VWA domain-containing protein [Bacillus sp. T33-2]PLR98740.1 stress protein [Bacillus sp. T33-2]
MTVLVKGQRINLAQKFPQLQQLRLSVSWQLKPEFVSALYDVDVSVFMINNEGKIPAEEYFVFYNNPESPDNALSLLEKGQSVNIQEILIELAGINKDVTEIVFVLTIHDASSLKQNFSHFQHVKLGVVDTGNNQPLFTYVQDQFAEETACELASIYQKDAAWRFNPVGQGYNAGLQEFLDQYHGSGAAEQPNTATLEAEPNNFAATGPVKSNAIPAAADHAAAASPLPAARGPVTLSKLDLLKKKVDVVILKKSLQKTTARIGVVLDISGSMRRLYNNGTVQNVVERLLALATRFDDDGVLDVWVYDMKFSRLPSVTELTLPDYINREVLNNNKISKFRANNEPPVMRDVIQKYLTEDDGSLPVYLIFINDGGIKRSARGQDSVTKVLTDSSDKPIFWQFVGIGDANFDVLRKLDDLEGRYIDNANFFHILDIEKETDEDLYDKLLSEFPSWLHEARNKKIIQ